MSLYCEASPQGRPFKFSLVPQSPPQVGLDALATSFMVMGKEKAIDFIASNPSDSILCFMVYDSAKSFKEWSNF